MSRSRQRTRRLGTGTRTASTNTSDHPPYAIPPNLTPEKKREIAGFWLRVAKSDTCWLWQGSVTTGGYGIYRRVLAHRYSYRISKGPIAGIIVRHVCDTPLCVKPSHLLGGTHRDNIADKVAKG